MTGTWTNGMDACVVMNLAALGVIRILEIMTAITIEKGDEIDPVHPEVIIRTTIGRIVLGNVNAIVTAID